MKLSELNEIIKLSFDSIRINKMRSLLASLGVVIGISFVVLMGWFLAGLDDVLEETINFVGVDMVYVDKWDWAGGRSWKLIDQRKPITYDQAVELASKMKTAEIAVPLGRKHGSNIKYGDDLLQNIMVVGTKSDYGLTPSGMVEIGRFFNNIDEQFSAKSVVIGWGIYKTLFLERGIEAIGKTIKINGVKFEIVGIVKKQGTLLMDFMDNQIYIPISTFQSLFPFKNRSFSVALKAGSVENMPEVRAEAEGIMRDIRNIEPGEENDFSLNESKSFEKTANTLRLIVGGIGIGMTALSFIVGIIGIMNIMFVSVTERTKEIGIRKAIGAHKRSILIQFVIESAALCFIGAILSIVGCSILVFLLATYLPQAMPSLEFLTLYIPVNIIIIATFVSVFVGMLAGFIPALRAANLNPVDALRYE
jgi:putative ABC transport system permease protein